jgi:lipopolysaccharide assembly outer membrane protein LptD (OstA)
VGRRAAGWSSLVLPLALWLLSAGPVVAQVQSPSEKLLINAKSAYTWSAGGSDVLLLRGPVSIELDRATLNADDAVVWLTAVPNGAPGEERAEFQLLGHAQVRHTNVATLTGGDRYVTAAVLAGGVKTTADQRVARDMGGDPLYVRALALRRQQATAAAPSLTATPTTQGAGPATRPGRRPTTRPVPAEPVQIAHFEAGQFDMIDTDDGTVALVCWNGVSIFARQPDGSTIELRAQRAVVFTSLHSVREATSRSSKESQAAEAKQKITAVYLEGDAQIEYDPTKAGVGEQRLTANRIYYEFATDRAILVDAVLHTSDVKQNIPFIVRAKVLRQLAKAEYNAEQVQLTSSAFSVPSYSIAADRLYVRQEATGDPRYPSVVKFEANDATFQAFDVPFFYLPFVSGSVGDRPGALRGIAVGHRSDLGYAAMTQWGLFETLGQIPPRDLDADYRVDYFSDRGPAAGLNASYGGGFLTEPAHQPWNFLGDFKSYFVYDKGTDQNLGRLPVKPDGEDYVPRGWALFEHQHFFPDHWQAQVRLGYVSDPTFLEEWFPDQFYENGPVNESAYIKRQEDTEAFTLYADGQPMRLITYSDAMANQFEVQHLPEVGYHRIGDSFAGDQLTFFSDNTAGGYQFQPTRATLQQQGFAPPTLTPGMPSLGLTGIRLNPTWRADFRQEIDWPFSTGHIKVVPYVVGRYTQYSDSPDGDEQHRFLGAAGTRITTAFWKTDPTAQSDLLDIHQLRHVVEPEVNLFSSATTVDRSMLFQYDIPVDSINDISAAEVGLRQRWQTQRGGPGRWRSVDVFTLDVDAEFYANKPAPRFRQPTDFRGMFFTSLPEASIARNALNADASWRVTDNTIILADAQYNLDQDKLATAALGVLLRRDPTESLYIGNRYIADLKSNIVSVSGNYQISPKYSLGFSQAFDFGLGKDVSSSLSVVRNFDRFVMSFNFSHDQISGQTGFSFSIAPLGFGQGIGSSALQGPFQRTH